MRFAAMRESRNFLKKQGIVENAEPIVTIIGIWSDREYIKTSSGKRAESSITWENERRMKYGQRVY